MKKYYVVLEDANPKKAADYTAENFKALALDQTDSPAINKVLTLIKSEEEALESAKANLNFVVFKVEANGSKVNKGQPGKLSAHHVKFVAAVAAVAAVDADMPLIEDASEESDDESVEISMGEKSIHIEDVSSIAEAEEVKAEEVKAEEVKAEEVKSEEVKADETKKPSKVTAALKFALGLGLVSGLGVAAMAYAGIVVAAVSPAVLGLFTAGLVSVAALVSAAISLAIIEAGDAMSQGFDEGLAASSDLNANAAKVTAELEKGQENTAEQVDALQAAPQTHVPGKDGYSLPSQSDAETDEPAATTKPNACRKLFPPTPAKG